MGKPVLLKLAVSLPALESPEPPEGAAEELSPLGPHPAARLRSIAADKEGCCESLFHVHLPFFTKGDYLNGTQSVRVLNNTSAFY